MPDFVGTLKTPRLAAAPSTPVVGQLYFNTGDNKLYYWNGSIWVAASGGSTVIDDTNLPARLSSTSLSIGDWNNATSNGWYFSGSVPNAPIQGYWLIGHVSTGNTGIIQNVWLRDLDQQWTRRYTTNPAGWTAWKQVPVIDDTTLPPRLTSINNPAPPGNNCNNAWEAGWYTCQPATNAPGGGWGSLLVFPWGGQTTSNYQSQLFFVLGNNTVWVRNCYGQTFSAWAQIYPIDDAGLPERLRTIPKLWTASCDDAVTSGWYAFVPDATNAPVAGTYGMVIVSVLNVPSNVRQLWFSYSTNEIYARRRQDGNWYPWVQVYPIDLVYKGDFVAGSYKDGDVVVQNGIAYMCVRPTSAAPSASQWPAALGTPNYGTTLPASPKDGQEAILVPSVTSPQYSWRFRYNAQNTFDANKWEFIGGSPAYGFPAGSLLTSSTSPTPLTNGPTFVVPRSGVYQVQFGGQVQQWNVNQVDMQFWFRGSSSGNTIRVFFAGAQNATYNGSNVMGNTGANLVAGETVSIYVSINNAGGQANFNNGWFSLMPVRVQ